MNGLDILEGVRLAAAASLCGAGCLALAASALAALRLPDFYTRLHAFTAMYVVGAPLVLAGLGVAAWDWRIAVKLALLGVLIVGLCPAIAQIGAHAAHGAGLTPARGGDAR